MKKIVRLTENDLSRIVKRVIRESENDDAYNAALDAIRKAQTKEDLDKYSDLVDKISGEWASKNRDKFDELMEYAFDKFARIHRAGIYDKSYTPPYSGDFWARFGRGDWASSKGMNRLDSAFDSDEYDDEEYGINQWDELISKYGYDKVGRMFGSGGDPRDNFTRYNERSGVPLTIRRKR